MTDTENTGSDARARRHVAPTISIYQNPDHVAGILQQMFFQPLVTNQSREHSTSSSSTEGSEGKGHLGAHAEAKVPALGSVGVDASGDRGGSFDSGLKADAKTVLNFTYSQAYYLLEVREALRQRDLIRTISNASNAADLKSGDFVEFEGTFRPSSLHSLLDILTPDLVAAFTDHYVKNEGLKLYTSYSDFDKVKIFSEQLYAKAENRSNLARAAAEAVRVDFRAQKTREFYGTISDVTAITICDNSHFVVEDEDRILDGSYTVLGKATSMVEYDLPILSRNKLLDRLSPELVDSLFESFRNSATAEAVKLDRGDGEEEEIENAFDLALPSRIAGPSFKVVPIAIYA